MTRTDTTDTARALEVLRKIAPGPWTYFVGNANGRGLIRIECVEDGHHLASMVRGPRSEANARAIAVTPHFVALFAAAVELRAAERNRAKVNEDGYRPEREPEFKDALQRLVRANGSFDAALAAVTKGVLGHE